MYVMGRYRKFLLQDETIVLALKYDGVERSITLYARPRNLSHARMFFDYLVVVYSQHSNCRKHPNRYWLVDENRYSAVDFDLLLEDFRGFWVITECKSLKRWKSRTDMGNITGSWEKYFVKHPEGDIGIKYNNLYRNFIIGGQHRHREHVKLLFNSLLPDRTAKVTQFGYHTYRLSVKVSDVEFNRILSTIRQTYEVVRAVNMKGVTR